MEAVLRGESLRSPPPRLLVVKFLGGVLAIGAGLALGREGPSVQMGAGLADAIAGFFRRNKADVMALLAAGAAAGLATAFNAPVAGAVFILEEVVRRFDIRHSITTLGASACAIAAARVLLGGAPDFTVAPLPYAGSRSAAALPCAGRGRRLSRGGLQPRDPRRHRGPGTFPPLAGGSAGRGDRRRVGLTAWFLPDLVGGGEAITQSVLEGGETLLVLCRSVSCSVSRSGRSPMRRERRADCSPPFLPWERRAVSSSGLLCSYWFPGLAPYPMAFAVVGMAAFFTASVRAPVTGIVLITEMTASFTLLLPLVAACFAAMVVPTMMHTEPIYDSLREPAAQQRRG